MGGTMPGRLVLAATPIGNLGDTTQRLMEAFASFDEIWCEDTRVTRKLLTALDISKPLRAFHEHSDRGVMNTIANKLDKGLSLLYVSDAGMPAVSDPGFELVRIAREVQAEVDVLPGPSAVLTALVLSGAPCHEFAFMGFFPERNQSKLLKRLSDMGMTSIFFESPRRIVRTLTFLHERIPNQVVAVCREMTKLHQQVVVGTPEEVLLKLKVLKGEMVLVIWPMSEVISSLSAEDYYGQLLDDGLSPKQALKQTSLKYSINKRELYKQFNTK
ncbi:MAG: 16S rRNA (cytidine(1402)-2'-O)-methyltransferase [Acidobacteria bacterium]|nr:MAG: 16S rRNA (cytidine(1402)-2'-O)-methyltransferase [Acidobacteriota bacterium]